MLSLPPFVPPQSRSNLGQEFPNLHIIDYLLKFQMNWKIKVKYDSWPLKAQQEVGENSEGMLILLLQEPY